MRQNAGLLFRYMQQITAVCLILDTVGNFMGTQSAFTLQRTITFFPRGSEKTLSYVQNGKKINSKWE